jgi:AcrR family transcriptional regulator
MKDAGLTHGGFYAHFESREALLTEAMERSRRDMAAVIETRAARPRKRDVSAFRALVDAYLADDNLPALETACPVAAIASDLARSAQQSVSQDDDLRSAGRNLVVGLIAGVRKALPVGAPAESAAAIASTLVGALQLARALGRGSEARRVLAAARNNLLKQYDSGLSTT